MKMVHEMHVEVGLAIMAIPVVYSVSIGLTGYFYATTVRAVFSILEMNSLQVFNTSFLIRKLAENIYKNL